MSCSSPEAGRDPAAAAAAAHPTLALGRHHHSHHHINAAITSRGRKRGGGTEGSHSWAQREREGGRREQPLQSWESSQCGGEGVGGVMGGINCLFIYIYYRKSKGQGLRHISLIVQKIVWERRSTLFCKEQ